MQGQTSAENIYKDGAYLANNPSWHLEDSPFKARQVLQMLNRHTEMQVNSVCEIGSGAGGILHELQKGIPHATFKGYEISPQAHKISTQFENERCRFVLQDAFSDNMKFDLVLLMDVIEHVEDCFTFLRKAREKGRYVISHIPITHASSVLRGLDGIGWNKLGHIHMFTLETASLALVHSGHRIIDKQLTHGAEELPNKGLKTHLLNPLRRILSSFSETLTVRALGGYSLLVLSE